ncbi:uncharacterized protein LOC134272245 [Saccostrea cucullata]|uniref:uncharacterized protein LOC134272245 n=1 Tax=Saccostrea cuccullata TaxID=36930 RepID=UPI002ED333F2
MAVTKTLIIYLSTSAGGIFLCFVALVTPGWISVQEGGLAGVFYMCAYRSGQCSAFLYDDIATECDGLIHIHLIDAQLAGVLGTVLGVVGWLVLLVYAISKESSASLFVTSGIILLVASTFEFFLLVKFIVVNVVFFKKAEWAQFGFPFSMIISSSGLVLIMFTVVRIFIRNKQMINNCNSMAIVNARAITTEPSTSLV